MTEPTYIVRKHGTRLPVTVDMLLAAGELTEDQARDMGWTPPPKPPRLRVLRWEIRRWWYHHRPRVHLGPCEEWDE